jgi:hypothetical protein
MSTAKRSTATRMTEKPSELPVADSHDLIRV